MNGLGQKSSNIFFSCTIIDILFALKSSRNKKDLNDVTAAPFSVFFLLLAAEKKTPKTGQLCHH